MGFSSSPGADATEELALAAADLLSSIRSLTEESDESMKNRASGHHDKCFFGALALTERQELSAPTQQKSMPG
jgi:hypothetical protein